MPTAAFRQFHSIDENPQPVAGFSADRVLAVELQLPPSRYKTNEAVRQFYARLLQQVHREPGVESAGAVNCPPSTGGCAKGWYSIADMPAPARADVPLALLTRLDQDYFQAIRMTLLGGRAFTDADRDNGRAVVVNEKLARHWWPDSPQLAVGQRIKFGGPYIGPSSRQPPERAPVGDALASTGMPPQPAQAHIP